MVPVLMFNTTELLPPALANIVVPVAVTVVPEAIVMVRVTQQPGEAVWAF